MSWKKELKKVGQSKELEFAWTEIIPDSQKSFFESESEGETTIYLVRHGKTKLNKLENSESVDRIRGWQDHSLDSSGLDQADALADFLVGRGIEKVISSDLSRAKVTGEKIAETLDIPIITTQNLRPWNLGELQGQETKKVQPLLEEYITKKPMEAPQNGESFSDFLNRYINCMYKIMNEVKSGVLGDCAVVAHFRNLKATESWFEAGQDKHRVDEKVMLEDTIPVGSILRIVYNPDSESWGYSLLKCETK